MNINEPETKLYKNGRLATYVPTVPKGLKFTINKKLIFFVKLALAGLLLWMLVDKIDPVNLKNAFLNAKPGFILLGLILVLPNLYAQFLKWRFLVQLAKPGVTNFEVFSSLFAGFTLGFVTPGRIGEFGRALFIEKCSRTQVVGLAMIDKFFSMLVVLGMGTLGLFFLLGVHLKSPLRFLWLGLAVLSLAIVFWFAFFPEKMRTFFINIRKRLPENKRIDLLISCLNNFRRPQALWILLLALFFYGVMTTQFVLLFNAFETIPWYLGYLVTFSIFITKSLLPISLGDLGIRESAAIFFVAIIGGADSTAFNASILIFLINLALPSLAGLILMLTPKLNRQFLDFKLTNPT